MKIYIGFEELSRQIKERFGQDVAFGKISDRDLRVTYRKKALIVTIPVSVDLTLTEVKPESVALKYHMFVGLGQDNFDGDESRGRQASGFEGRYTH